MNPTNNNAGLINKPFAGAVLALIVLLLVTVFTSLHIKQTTGKLNITSFAKDSTISISQNNREAKVVGVGSAKLRLAAGSYEVVANSAGYTAIGHVTIQKQKTSSIYLTDKQTPPLASSDTITFNGIDTFVNRGITNAQAGKLQRLFFKYNEQAKVVTVDTNSVERGPRVPDSGAPFSFNFTGTIDSKSYKATITYKNLDDLTLAVYDPITGSQLFSMSSTDLPLAF